MGDLTIYSKPEPKPEPKPDPEPDLKSSDDVRQRVFDLFNCKKITFDEMASMLDNLETKSKPDKVLNCYPYSVTPKQLEQFTSIVGLPKILTKVLTDTYYYDEEQNILHYINPESQVQEKICVNDDNKKQFEQICSKVANYMLNCIGRGHNNVISIHKKDPDVLYGTYDLNSIMNIQLYLNSNKVEVMRNVFLYSII